MEPHKISVQYKEDGEWKTLCTCVESKRIEVEPILKALEFAYKDARVVDYEEAHSKNLETASYRH